MAAVSRSEARRRAILSRGNDRLAKLTASARGADAPAFLRDDQSSSGTSTGLEAFIGEESDMPSRTVPVSSASSTTSAPSTDSTPWSEEQQKQFLEALMGGSSPASFRSRQSPLPGIRQEDDPFLSSIQAPRLASNQGTIPPRTAPPTSWRKFMPLAHLIAVWILLGYFVSFQEPNAFEAHAHGGSISTIWQRWADLNHSSSSTSGFLGVQFVYFFWAFISLQILLHSIRILYGYDAIQHSWIMAAVLPHLPPPLSSAVVNVLKYLQMGGIFLDDVAAVIVGLGLLVWFSGWLTSAV